MVNGLARLDLANRVMRETTRLHPAGVVFAREAAVDVTVGGFRIPKGTLILWSSHLAGRDPRAWTDPLRFDPDRFVDPRRRGQQALADLGLGAVRSRRPQTASASLSHRWN